MERQMDNPEEWVPITVGELFNDQECSCVMSEMLCYDEIKEHTCLLPQDIKEDMVHLPLFRLEIIVRYGVLGLLSAGVPPQMVRQSVAEAIQWYTDEMDKLPEGEI